MIARSAFTPSLHRPPIPVLRFVVLLSTPLLVAAGWVAPLAGQDAPPTPAEVLADAPDEAWRWLDPERTVYMTLEGQAQVILELDPRFAPRHVENIRAMIRARLFDGGSVVRSQENYVVQWTSRPVPDAEQAPIVRGIATTLEPELTFDATRIPFTPLPDGDVYAPEVGFSGGFPVGRDPETGRGWVIHCYGVVGVARGNAPNSGNGASLYAVSGHSPRHLDRNLSMPGRILSGMEHLSALPRGTEPLGFYATEEELTTITSVRLGAELPPEDRAPLQVMRTDSPTFQDWITARRTRTGPWWINPPGAASVCNVDVPTRDAAPR